MMALHMAAGENRHGVACGSQCGRCAWQPVKTGTALRVAASDGVAHGSRYSAERMHAKNRAGAKVLEVGEDAR